MKLCFFDTETTGKEADDQIIQLGLIYGSFDEQQFNEERRINQYINTTKNIHPEAEKIHGINKDRLNNFFYINNYIDEILLYIKKADYVIGHNIEFDLEKLKGDCKRIGKVFDWDNVKSICTMKTTIDIVKLPGSKRPKLTELYKYLFGKDFNDAHDAMADIEATKNCFIELFKRGYISLKPKFNDNKSNFSRNESDMYADMKKIYSEPDDIDVVNGDYESIRANNDETLIEVIEYGDINTIEKVIKGGANVNARGKYGITVLMSAFYNSYIDYNGVKRLIELGANINAKDRDGQTTFMKACESGRGYDILDLLLQNGADINAKDNRGLTALSYVIAYDQGKKLAKFLQSRGGRDSRSIFTKIMSNYW